jgi:hypothetical protein
MGIWPEACDLGAQAGDELCGFTRADSPFSGLYRFWVNFRGVDGRFHDARGSVAGIQQAFGHRNELCGDETDHDGPMDFLEGRLAVWGNRLWQG